MQLFERLEEASLGRADSLQRDEGLRCNGVKENQYMLHVTAANDDVNHVGRPAASFSDQAGDAKTGLTQRLGNLLTFII